MSPSDEADGGRQRIERVRGSRRARLTPAPGTAAEPIPGDEVDEAPAPAKDSGPNDAQLRRDVPPHY
ncbi:MAG TPA: hypothetical protein VFY91_05575 [Microbacterium sp.]|nr:hypothetical protein [Microbacterium sp.]